MGIWRTCLESLRHLIGQEEDFIGTCIRKTASWWPKRMPQPGKAASHMQRNSASLVGTAQLSVSPLPDIFYASNGDPYRMLGIAVDITARRQAEQAQRESEDKLRLILDSTAEAIYGSDREGLCTFCNPPAFTYWAMNEQTNFSARICII